MKKIILLSLTLVISELCLAQVPNWLWAESSNGTSNYEYMYGMSVDTTTNSLFVGGRCGGTNNFGGLPMTGGSTQNPFAGRFNENGDATWLSEYTYSSDFDYPWGFYADAKDNTYLDGITSSGLTSFIEKYNSAGAQQWEITPGSDNFSGHGIAVDGAGAVYITGELSPGSLTLGSTTLNYSGSGDAVVVAKLDPSGNFIWAKAFYGTGSEDGQSSGRGITIDSHANIYIVGSYQGAPSFGSLPILPTTGASNLFILKMDSSGNPISVVTAIAAGYANNDCCSNTPITIDSCDNLYLTSYFNGTAQFGDYVLTSYGGQDVFAAKCDHDGFWDWAQDFGGTGNDGPEAITLDKYTDVYETFGYQNGAAQIEGTSITGGDMAVVKLDNGKGYVDWIQTAGSPNGGDGPGGIAVDNNGYVYIEGNFSSSTQIGSTTLTTSYTGTDFLAKLDRLDSLNQISITPKPDSVYCAGRTYTLSYTITGTFSPGNIFTVQLSNSLGSFTPPVNIGSYISDSSGKIVITIPPSTPYGTHYRIRILSTKPSIITTVPTSSCIDRLVDTSYFYITIYPIPSLVITGKNTICPGDTTTLSTFGADHYLWDNGDTTSSITVTPSITTTYTVKLTNGPCIYNDTTTVYIDPLPVITVRPDTSLVCFGRGLSLSASGASTYRWSPSSGLNAHTGSAVYAGPDITTTYTVTGTDSNGCVGKTTAIVDVAAQPTASFTASVPSPCKPEQLLFTNTSNDDSSIYTWRFGDGTTSNETNPLHIYNSTGTYKVTIVVTTSRGCVDSFSTMETVNSINFVAIPNAFTPGTEGLNQVFKPNVLCTDLPGYTFRVYDRWGVMVFESSNPNEGWDGTYNGKAEPLDVYVYYLKMTCGICSVFDKGNVTLIR